jgi:hypothetical protein
MLPGSDDLRAKIPKMPLDQDQRLQNPKSSLKLAYKAVGQSNRRSHLKNKRLYDRKAKNRSFETGDLVYLYSPAVKPGLTRKFHTAWSGSHRVTAKVTELNYEIVDQKGRNQVVHSNRLKPYNGDEWEPRVTRRSETLAKNHRARLLRLSKAKTI